MTSTQHRSRSEMGQTTSSSEGVDPAGLLANEPDAEGDLLAATVDAPEPQQKRGWFKRRRTAQDDAPQGTQRTTWARRLAHITAEVEGDIQPLVQTPSSSPPRSIQGAQVRVLRHCHTHVRGHSSLQKTTQLFPLNFLRSQRLTSSCTWLQHGVGIGSAGESEEREGRPADP